MGMAKLAMRSLPKHCVEIVTMTWFMLDTVVKAGGCLRWRAMRHLRRWA